jgi:hypothetical protein
VRRVLSAWVRAAEKAERGTVWGRRGIARKEGVRGGGHHGAGGEGGGAAADRSRPGRPSFAAGYRDWRGEAGRRRLTRGGGWGGADERGRGWAGGRCRFTEASGRCRLAEGRTRGGSLPLRALIGSIDTSTVVPSCGKFPMEKGIRASLSPLLLLLLHRWKVRR